jgi:hypothetical protein
LRERERENEEADNGGEGIRGVFIVYIGKWMRIV